MAYGTPSLAGWDMRSDRNLRAISIISIESLAGWDMRSDRNEHVFSKSILRSRIRCACLVNI